MDAGQRNFHSTVVALLGKQAICGHVGDSRLYFFKQKQLVFQTEDHSVPQALVRAGELSAAAIRQQVDRNRLLSSMGGPQQPKYDVRKFFALLEDGDVFLLCTDGFWEYIVEEEMGNLLSETNQPDRWLTLMEQHIIQKAPLDHDNYSAIAIFKKEGKGIV